MTVPLVHFQPAGRKVECREGSTILDLARDAGVSIESICGSTGKCGKCRVIVRAGEDNIKAPTERETNSLAGNELRAGIRLACQAKVATAGKIVIEVPESSRRGHHRLLAAGIEPSLELAPALMKVVLRIPPASLEDVRADDDRLLEMLYKKAQLKTTISPGVHGSLPDALRKDSWTSTVTLFRKAEMIRVEPGDTSSRLYGIAVDIGTTKVVAYLIDLLTGRVLGNESIPNPQIPFGEDLMSRISYISRNKDGQEKLQGAIVNGLNELIQRLCSANKLDTEDVLEVMIVGNTAMHHIFFGIPTKHLASAPYAPAVRTSITTSAAHAGLGIYPFGKVSSLPNIAGFVGADAVADLLSSGLHKDRNVGMMIDIGTNTEIIAGNRSRLVSCSCASGPAFEGAHIKFGMRASTGAVERVWIDPATLDVRVRTVDDGRARGICGSGIVDAISELLKAGVLEPSGRIKNDLKKKSVRKSPEGHMEFVLVPGKDTETGKEITVTQQDIQEIQLAKAAIFTGVSVLMKKLGTRSSEIRKVYAAGAFGTYVDASSAINIGMYPDVPVDRIEFIGNAAGSGARMCLKSTKMRDLADKLSREVEYVELAAEKGFQNEFAMAMFLPHRDKSRFPNHGK